MASDTCCSMKRAVVCLAFALVVFFAMQGGGRPREAVAAGGADAQLLGADGRVLQDSGSSSADRLAARYARYQQGRFSAEHKKARVLNYSPHSAQAAAVLEDDYDVIMVGAGLSGGVLAERLARLAGAKVLLLDKRHHIGGNCYDYLDPDAHILVNKARPRTPPQPRQWRAAMLSPPSPRPPPLPACSTARTSSTRRWRTCTST